MKDFIWGTGVIVGFFGAVYLIGGLLENLMGGPL